jgi:CysZ protein
MIRALAASFDQLTDAAILRVLAKSLAITLVLTAGLAVLASYGSAALFNHWVDTAPQDSTYQVAEGVLGALMAIAIFVFGFRLIAIPVISVFADDVVAAVEARHFPSAAKRARRVSIATSLRLGLGSVARLIGFNLLALPGYIVLAITGVGTVLLFGLVNALLLGRDLGEMVAVRHLDPEARAGWLRATRIERLILGLIVTGLFLVPLINLIAPVIGAAMATHLFHAQKAGGARA